jgi:pseudouridine synthase
MSKESVRLQKFLAHQGIASRRKCEEYIQDGLVEVNGKIVTEMGTKIDPKNDRIYVNHQEIEREKSQAITLMLYKPRGYTCTSSTEEGRNVYQLIGKIQEKVASIGRLDKKSEGLLLFSNDGDLVYQLTHPSFGSEKFYSVVISGSYNDKVLKKLNQRMKIDDYMIKPASVIYLRSGQKKGRHVLEFILKEGRHHQIRKMCEKFELTVHRLTRTRVKNLVVQGLAPGKWRYLTSKEVKMLKATSQNT